MVPISKQIIPALEDYSKHDLEKICQLSPAFMRYQRLLTRVPQVQSEKIRIDRHKEWLRFAAASMLDKADAKPIGLEWSLFTKKLLQSASTHFANSELGMFALGKLGGDELNISSDIDLFFISKETPTPEQFKIVRDFINLFSETTDFGFCFRVDIEIRPGGPSSPVISSIKQFEDFYWNYGEPWHRLAFIRMDFISGCSNIGDDITEMANKYSFRKFLDYSMFDSFGTLRKQIQKQKATLNDKEINLKFSRGGIRDIELFIHSLQVIHGGKILDLQTRHFDKAIETIVDQNLFDKRACLALQKNYWLLRALENFLQSENDQRTYSLLDQHYGLIPLQHNKNSLLRSLSESDEHVSQLLGKVDPDNSLNSATNIYNVDIKKLGFNSHSAETIWPELLKLTSKSQRKQRDEDIRAKFLDKIVHKIAKLDMDKDLAIGLLYDFVKSTRAKASFFSLLLTDDKLLDDLVMLFSSSPYLGGIISSRPELLDSFILKTQDIDTKNSEILLEQLFEKKLLGEVISANQFLQNKNIAELCVNLSESADSICSILLRSLQDEFNSDNIDLLCLGKWGGREMGLRSDIDFAFVTDTTPTEEDQKVAKRFLNRITGQHRGGAIFDVDLRLRPTGNVGPLIVSKDQLRSFLDQRPDAWKRQSYLKMRFMRNNQSEYRDSLLQHGVSAQDLTELKEIRSKLLIKKNHDSIDLKMCPGGLTDIELCLQTLVLVKKINTAPSTESMFDCLLRDSSLASDNIRTLKKNYYRLRLIEQLNCIFFGHSGNRIDIDNPENRRILQYLSIGHVEFIKELRGLISLNQSLLKTLDPIYSI